MYLSRFLDFFDWPQNDPKNSENCKIFQFYAIFVKLSINFPALNVENIPNRKNCYPRRFFKEKKCNFLMKKCLKFRPKLTKILENSEFWKFYAVFVYFSKNMVA